MKTTHTPGPWNCGWGDGLTGPTTPAIDGPTVAGGRWGYTPVRKGMETLAICPNQVDFGRSPVEGSSAANARLIAAAPELLEAVVQLAEDLEDGHWSSTKAALRRLIAKATGGQP